MKSFRHYVNEKVAAFNIGRSSMPQIHDQEKFKSYLDSKSISHLSHNVPIDFVTPIQADIDQKKVQSIDLDKPTRPIIVSDSFYILDGHHRYFAHMLYDMDGIDVIQVDTGINQLLALANDYVEEGSLDDS